MMNNQIKIIRIAFFCGLAVFLLAGCSHTPSTELSASAETGGAARSKLSDLEEQLSEKDLEVKRLRAIQEENQFKVQRFERELASQKEYEENARKEIARLEREAQEARQEATLARQEVRQVKEDATSAKSVTSYEKDIALLPPMAAPGECFARVFIPPKYETVAERVLKKEESYRVEIVPAKYEWVEETVLVKEASEKLEIVPARYETVEERVLVKPVSSEMKEIPATYEWQEEKLLVKPAHKVWKKGRGLIEKVDNTTGEIMCLVEIPASYRTVKKQVLKTPATVKEVELPAEYKTIKKQIMAERPSTRTHEVPAEYAKVRVRKLVTPAMEKRIPVPAEYETVTRTQLVADGFMEWRSVLCQTNASRELVQRIQSALLKAGHDPGPIDGVIGKLTMAAVKSFQKQEGLAQGALTNETIQRLGVKIPSSAI